MHSNCSEMTLFKLQLQGGIAMKGRTQWFFTISRRLASRDKFAIRHIVDRRSMQRPGLGWYVNKILSCMHQKHYGLTVRRIKILPVQIKYENVFSGCVVATKLSVLREPHKKHCETNLLQQGCMISKLLCRAFTVSTTTNAVIMFKYWNCTTGLPLQYNTKGLQDMYEWWVFWKCRRWHIPELAELDEMMFLNSNFMTCCQSRFLS